MKTKLSILFFFILFSSFQQANLVKTKVNEAITIYLPEGFFPMSQADIETRYDAAKLPVAIYTDYSRTVDMGINVAYSQWNAEDLDIMRSFYKSNILGLYDEVQFVNEGVEKINGLDYAIFEFVSSVIDEEGTTVQQNAVSKYTRIQYTIVKGKTVLFNFTCPASQREKWAPVARQIMQTVKISKTL
ncbi:MAG: hypothetical protein HC819_20300 [Cyclobacteriaceae bacterium]|nr:hypothetical protein [Cyclobacteriaceae bacterium]